MDPAPILSVVIPVRNEAANIGPLLAETRTALAAIPHEIIVVDDGSTDATVQVLRAETGRLRLLRHATRHGQSAAIHTGILAAGSAWIATMDGDGQNDPADIPALFARARAGAPGIIVCGHRTTRRDSRIKRLTSSFANGLRAWLLGDATPDTGCGLKLFRRDDFLRLPAFDHMHRFLPALFLRAGGSAVSVPVSHRPRLRGRSNYGTLDRAWVGLFDLIGVGWLQRRPMRPSIAPMPPLATDPPVFDPPVFDPPVFDPPVFDPAVFDPAAFDPAAAGPHPTDQCPTDP